MSGYIPSNLFIIHEAISQSTIDRFCHVDEFSNHSKGEFLVRELAGKLLKQYIPNIKRFLCFHRVMVTRSSGEREMLWKHAGECFHSNHECYHNYIETLYVP